MLNYLLDVGLIYHLNFFDRYYTRWLILERYVFIFSCYCAFSDSSFSKDVSLYILV